MNAYRADLERLLTIDVRDRGCTCPVPLFELYDGRTLTPLRPDVDIANVMVCGRVIHLPGCPADEHDG